MEALLVPLPPPIQDVLPCLACRQPLKPEAFHQHLQECEAAWPAADTATLQRCKYCARCFLPYRLTIHENVCPAAQQKRPAFEKSQQCILPKVPTLCKNLTRFAQKKWYKQHLSVLNSIRYGQNEFLYDNYVQCPTCLRRFAPHAADRHLLLCRSSQQKLPRLVVPNRLEKSRSGAAPLRQVANLIKDSRSATCLSHAEAC